MAFTTVKTNWQVQPYVNGIYQGDWFTLDDYVRITNNIMYLYNLAKNVYAIEFNIPRMRSIAYTDIVMPDDINHIEVALYTIMQNTVMKPSYPGVTTWSENGYTPTFDDLNRYEGACQFLYDTLVAMGTVKNFVPSGSTRFITSDGKVFTVK